MSWTYSSDSDRISLFVLDTRFKNHHTCPGIEPTTSDLLTRPLSAWAPGSDWCSLFLSHFTVLNVDPQISIKNRTHDLKISSPGFSCWANRRTRAKLQTETINIGSLSHNDTQNNDSPFNINPVVHYWSLSYDQTLLHIPAWIGFNIVFKSSCLVWPHLYFTVWLCFYELQWLVRIFYPFSSYFTFWTLLPSGGDLQELQPELCQTEINTLYVTKWY